MVYSPIPRLGHDERYGIFGANADDDIREQENSDIRYIGRFCGYQITVAKTRNQGRISYT